VSTLPPHPATATRHAVGGLARHAVGGLARHAAPPLDLEQLRAAGFVTVICRDEVASTMIEAAAVAAAGADLPAVVIAARQSQGRGRRDAGWWQAADSLAASLVLAPPVTDGPRPGWSLACGVAVAETLRAVEPGITAGVRWPNDIEVLGRKLAGILVEVTTAGRVIFGIGINTAGHAADAPEPLRQRLVTVPDLIGRSLDRTAVLAGILPRLVGIIAEMAADPETLVRRHAPLCSLTGRHVVLHDEPRQQGGPLRHEGTCRGIGTDGGLVLETAAGLRRFITGSLTPPGEVWRPEPVQRPAGVAATQTSRPPEESCRARGS
jgi:BirA family biotin operon repressor/biotin-[acetyl-CoA-carboxylase] ligase